MNTTQHDMTITTTDLAEAITLVNVKFPERGYPNHLQAQLNSDGTYTLLVSINDGDYEPIMTEATIDRVYAMLLGHLNILAN